MKELIYYLLFVNLLTATMMAWDKFCAMNGRWRVREKTLFSLAAIGGSPTMFFLIRYLRHKSRKGAFLWRLHVIMLLQGGALVAYWVLR